MPLGDLGSLSAEARDKHEGIGAFNVAFLEHGEAQVAGAEAANRPVILQVSQNAVAFHRGRLAPIGSAVLQLGIAAAVPVVVHLDHANDVDLCRAAVDLGFGSVMFDGSHLDYESNVKATAEVVGFCHAAGVTVEAELGEVGGKNGVHDPSARTSVSDAEQFVEQTGVDLLAVAVGSSHTMTTRGAELDLELIAELRDAVPVPLVLHGSSGVSDAGMRAAIAAGMTKINVSTHLNVLHTAQVRASLLADPALVDPRRYMERADKVIEREVTRLLHLYAGTAGRPARAS